MPPSSLTSYLLLQLSPYFYKFFHLISHLISDGTLLLFLQIFIFLSSLQNIPPHSHSTTVISPRYRHPHNNHRPRPTTHLHHQQSNSATATAQFLFPATALSSAAARFHISALAAYPTASHCYRPHIVFRTVRYTSPDAPRPKRARASPVAHGVDLCARYDAPFPIYIVDERNFYMNLCQQEMNQHKTIYWEMVEALGIKESLTEYLTNLSCLEFATTAFLSIKNLCYEMIATFYLYSGGTQASCRLNGEVVNLTVDVMHSCFGFTNEPESRLCPPG